MHWLLFYYIYFYDKPLKNLFKLETSKIRIFLHIVAVFYHYCFQIISLFKCKIRNYKFFIFNFLQLQLQEDCAWECFMFWQSELWCCPRCSDAEEEVGDKSPGADTRPSHQSYVTGDTLSPTLTSQHQDCDLHNLKISNFSLEVQDFYFLKLNLCLYRMVKF